MGFVEELMQELSEKLPEETLMIKGGKPYCVTIKMKGKEICKGITLSLIHI